MKKLYVLFLLIIFFAKANAQWVTIPDANFASFLQQNYPQCMNGNQMDTTCSAIVNATYMDCSLKTLSNLTGIEYFDNLDTLDCSLNQLTILPALPASLTTLYCYGSLLISLPPLPASLTTLWSHGNNLISLPSLPSSLIYLYCHDNQLVSLPALPASLNTLSCTDNQITSLPALPNSLKKLYCSENNLNILPTLPSMLTHLHCNSNQLTYIPTLPSTLFDLQCNENQLTFLPTLPSSLMMLRCNENQLSTLPSLPPLLSTLDCGMNLLTSLPILPSNIASLECYSNQLTFLPEIPNFIYNLVIYDNPNLNCLPKLNEIYGSFLYYNTGVQCLPSYPSFIGPNPLVNPPLSSLPLCDLFNNPNNCDVYWNISGKVFNDVNNNCIDDAGEQGLTNLKLQLFQNGNLIQQGYSGNEGLYSFDTDTGTFTYTVDTTDLPVLVTCPSSGFHTSVLTPAYSMDYNMDFGLQCKPGFDVGVKNIVRQSGQLFPANYATVKIGAGDMASFYGLTCATGVSGNVIVNFTGPVTFISEAPGALIPVVNGNTLTYTISDFSLVNFNADFRFIVQTDTFAQAGTPVCFNVNVTPTSGDNDATNNSLQHCFTVFNSFDPNAKEVYPEGGITPSHEWMTYTIHFQNTGNAPAQNIYILDTLDQNLIPSTFTLLSYSHDPLVQLFGNVVKFNFPNINLPDSINDEPNSHGFVQYKVRMAQGLPVGTVISNTAYNFFDFNPPVATNIVLNVVGVTSITNHFNKSDLSIYPNPASDELKIAFNLYSNSEIRIELYNSLGQIVKTINKGKLPTGKNEINFSVAGQPVGVYHLKATVNNQTTMRKIVKY